MALTYPAMPQKNIQWQAQQSSFSMIDKGRLLRCCGLTAIIPTSMGFMGGTARSHTCSLIS